MISQQTKLKLSFISNNCLFILCEDKIEAYRYLKNFSDLQNSLYNKEILDITAKDMAKNIKVFFESNDAQRDLLIADLDVVLNFLSYTKINNLVKLAKKQNKYLIFLYCNIELNPAELDFEHENIKLNSIAKRLESSDKIISIKDFFNKINNN